MANGCNFRINIESNKALAKLKQQVSRRTTTLIPMINHCIEAVDEQGVGIPTKDFKEFWNTLNKGVELDFNTDDEVVQRRIADTMVEYFDNIPTSVEKTAYNGTDDENVIRYGYASAQVRTDAISFTVGAVIEVSSKYQNDAEYKKQVEEKKEQGTKTDPTTWDFYVLKIKQRLNFDLRTRLEAKLGKSMKDEIKAAKKDKTKNYYVWLREQFGSDISYEDSNFLAYFEEVFTNPDFFEKLRGDSRLGNVRSNLKNSELEELDETIAEQDNDDDDDAVTSSTEETNGMLKAQAAAAKGEQPSDITKQLSNNIRDYLYSLRVLSSTEKVDGEYQEVRNSLGTRTFMDGKQALNVLLGCVDCYNIDSMIESIRRISEQVPGYQAFVKLADDLEKDNNFAMALYKDISRMLMSKVEVVLSGSGPVVQDNSGRIDRHTKFRFDSYNDTRHNVLNNDVVQVQERYERLKGLIGAISLFTQNNLEDDLRKAKDDFIKDATVLLKIFNNDITEQVVEHFLSISEPNSKYKDANSRFIHKAQIIDSILGGSSKGKPAIYRAIEESQDRYTNIRTAIRENRKHNEKLMNSKNYDVNDLKPVDELYNVDYVAKSAITIANDIANNFLNSMVIDVELTGRNIKGKNVSNMVDATMMTNLIEYLQNDESIKDYGAVKFQSRQYDFSGILIEQRDEEGKVISKGLFKIENGKKVPTDYAKDLLRIRLFDGVREEYSDKALLYSEMAYGDFVNTAFDLYFQEDNFATYFMRIPSDAPKIFTVRAPKYDTSNLIKESNRGSLNAAVNREIDKLKDITIKHKATISDAYYISSTGEVIKHIMGKAKNIVLGAKAKEGFTKVTFATTINGNRVYYTMEGTVSKRKDTYYLAEPKLVNILDTNLDKTETKIPEALRGELFYALSRQYEKDGWINSKGVKTTLNYNIDKNHPVFKQYRNAFKKELHKMAIAINAMFVTDDEGRIVHEDGKPKFKPDWDTREKRLRKGIINYHFTKGKDVVDENGKFTGNVFKSNCFAFFVGDENNPTINNAMTSVIEDNLDFFDNAKTNSKHLKFTKEVNMDTGEEQVVGIDISNISDVVDDAITSFIIDYCADVRNRLSEEMQADRKGEKFNSDRIHEFALNTRLMYINMDDMFEGDSKFYGDGQTLLKRAKETQMGGTHYGAKRVGKDMLEVGKQHVNSILDGAGLKRKYTVNGETHTEDFTLELSDRFHAVTIQNTKREDAEVLKNLVKELVDNGTSEKVANQIIYGPEGDKGYQGTKVNDAQSYITFEEWVRRIVARGQYVKYKPLIEAILDETKPVDTALIQQFVQVQKNVYFDLHYDKATGIDIARQIKNAEFVLIPRFIKGTDLERVYNLMKELDIDQLNTSETSKAAKHQELVLFDPVTGDLTDDNIAEFKLYAKANEAREEYFYNSLYTQLETPQHINTTNKAAIQFMKKILDNIDNLPDIVVDGKVVPHPLKAKKKEIIDDYIANIMESYNDLLDELNIPRNEDGSIKVTNGVIEGLDAKFFLTKLRDELMRLGLDSNSIDYVTQVDEGSEFMDTVMPNFFGNFGKKLQNIAQAVFNSAITRQKLPGFHAVQVTQVGFGNTDPNAKRYVNKEDETQELTKAEYDILPEEDKLKYRNKFVRTSDKLRYHPNGQRYIEIMLPKSAFGFNRSDKRWEGKTEEQINREFLAELQKQGLDTLIGYRIPTEGKQSMCVMKVVDFVDDSYGSTIVVPDEWVAQTGSDFDVDSVYGFQFVASKDANGNYNKIKYNTSADFETDSKRLWMNYVARKTKIYLDGITDEEFNEIKATAKEETKAEVKAFREKQKIRNEYLFDRLSEDMQKKIKKVNAEAKKNKAGDKLTKEEYTKQLENQIAELTDYINNNSLSDIDITTGNEYISFITSVRNDITGEQKAVPTVSDRINKEIENRRQERYNAYKAIAEREGLMSEEDYIAAAKENPSMYNSKNARTNHMLQNMIDILSDNAMLEENLGRSNFDDIMAALDVVSSDYFKEERKNRSPYDFLNQAKYQEDAMSGAKLKAFSVTRDTFCSVCNTAHPVSPSVKIVMTYPKSMFTQKEIDKLALRFGRENVEVKDDKVVILHDRFGWSGDNRNIADRIITSYSSETTAHILDAIKEGAVPNVNDYTFGVYKTFVDMGCDYETAIAFMLNPVVTKIVKNYNRGKSIYSTEYIKAIDDTKRQLLEEASVVDSDLMSIDEINDYIDNEISNNAKEESFNGISFDKEKLIHWAKHPNDMNPNDALVMIRAFEKMYAFSQHITAIARCSNPDKFGAKQTLYATRKVFEDVNYILDTEEDSPTLTTEDGTHILEAIYPGIKEGYADYQSNGRNEESMYRVLDAFLRYSSATSILINSQLLTTQSENFVAVIDRIATYLSNKYVLSEQTHDKFEQWFLSSKYNEVPIIKTRVGFKVDNYKRNDNGEIELDNNGEPIIDTGATTGLFLEETDDERATIIEFQRIQGLNRSSVPAVINKNGDTVDFTVKNISYPTQEEINMFVQLSPGQKVEWIKAHVPDAGIFKEIRTRLTAVNVNLRKQENLQKLYLRGDNLDVEAAIEAFDKAFNNSNPLFFLAAIDLIKYAFVVEGYRVHRGALTKAIKNRALTASFGYDPENNTNGTGIVDECVTRIQGVNEVDASVDVYERFLRGNADVRELPKVSVKRTGKGKYELSRNKLGLIYVDPTNARMNNLLRKYNIIEETVESKAEFSVTNNGHTKYFRYNKYIRLSFGKENNLHKIKLVKNDAQEVVGIYLYPLNNLMANESTEFSVNPRNNVYPKGVYYEMLTDRLAGVDKTLSDDLISEKVRELAKEGHPRKDYMAPPVEKTVRTFDINTADKTITSGLESAIQSNYGNENYGYAGEIYVRNIPLTRRMPYTGVSSSLPFDVEITKPDGTKELKRFIVHRAVESGINKRFITGPTTGEIRTQKEQRLRDKALSESTDKLAPTLAAIINDVREAKGAVVINNLFVIKPYVEPVVTKEDDASYAVLSDVVSEEYSFLSKKKNREDVEQAAYSSMKYANVSSDAKVTTPQAVEQSMSALAEYVDESVEGFKADIVDCLTVDGVLCKPTDNAFIEAVKSDKALVKKIAKTINEVEAFLTRHEPYTAITVEDSYSIGTNIMVGKIQSKIQSLKTDSTIDELKQALVTHVVEANSTDPRIKDGLINVLTGLYETSAVASLFHDISDTNNPFIQSLLSLVQGEVSSVELVIPKLVEKFQQGYDAIVKEAKEEGFDINFANIIDEDGKWTRFYNAEFKVDYKTHIDTLKSLAKKLDNEPTPENMLKYLKAKHNYAKWKRRNIHQKLVDSFYDEELAIEEAVLTNAPMEYAKLELLKRRRAEIYKTKADNEGVLTDEQNEELAQINIEIRNLHSDSFYDYRNETFEPKTAEEKARVAALNEYEQKTKELYEKYYTKQNIYGFEELRNRYLTIVRTKEQRDPTTGRPSVDMATLADDKQYIEAREWLAKHTKERPSDKVLDELKVAYKTLYGEEPDRSLLSKFAEVTDAYDEKGVIDGRKLNDRQIENLKKDQQSKQNTGKVRNHSDDTLLNNAGKTNKVYTDAFYAKIVGGGIKAIKWKDRVKEFNDLVRPYWDASTGCIQTWLMDEETLQKVQEVIKALGETRHTVKGSGGFKAKRAFAFRSKNTKIEINDSSTNPSGFEYQKARAQEVSKTKGEAWYNLWLEVNTEVDTTEVDDSKPVSEREAEIVLDDDNKPVLVPSQFLYGRMVPKNETKYLDKNKTKAKETIAYYTDRVTTEYWTKALDEHIKARNRRIADVNADDSLSREEKQRKIQEAKDEYNKWYTANTIYNPYTRAIEPLSCWQQRIYLDTAEMENKPLWSQQRSVPKQAYINPNANPDGGIYNNYRHDNPEYDSKVNINKYEQRMMTYLQGILRDMVKTGAGRDYLKKGYAPARMGDREKDWKWYAKELGKFTGFSASYNDQDEWTQDIRYDDYKEPTMHMLAQLRDSKLKEPKMPVREQAANDEEYEKMYNEYEKKKEEYEKAHGRLLDRNWKDVFSDFISESARYNAMQDSKDMLFFGRSVLQGIRVNVRKFGFYGKFKPTGYDENGQPIGFETIQDINLIKQYDTFIRRFLYNQWKKSYGTANKVAGIMQNATSAKYMMLNIRGGISNVTYGESQVISEAFAREYFNVHEYLKGKQHWFGSIGDFLCSLNTGKNTTLDGALVRLFNVLDYDEINGVPRVLDIEESFKRARNYLFAQQSSGEHFMQNAALLTMLESHRLVEVGESDGIKRYAIQNLHVYKRGIEERVLREMLTEEQKQQFDEMFEKIKRNDETKRDYVYLKKDRIQEFVRSRLSKEEQKKYIKLRNQALKDAENAFNDDKAHPTLRSQFELKDGKAAFKEGSILSSIDNTNLENFGDIKPGDAMQLLGRFRRKVIAVNKRIHGVYDKLGAARFEEISVIGSLGMQYHKHLPVGINKRWKRRGSYNEERETLEKGTYQSIIDFLSIPARDILEARRKPKSVLPFGETETDEKGLLPEYMTEAESQLVLALQVMIKGYLAPLVTTNVFEAIHRNYELCSEIDRANLRRAATGLSSLCLSIAILIALKCIDTKDDKLKKLLGLGIYEADRLGTELFMYTPTGVLSEFKTLYSSPLAAQNILEDSYKTLNELCKMILEGEDYNPYYTTGRYAGKAKIPVYIIRNIPIYRQWEALMEIDKANDFYKIGSNNNFIPVDKIAKRFSK